MRTRIYRPNRCPRCGLFEKGLWDGDPKTKDTILTKDRCGSQLGYWWQYNNDIL